jgi:hypothetical protein
MRRRTQHVITDNGRTYMFPICMRLRINCRCRKGVFGRFCFRKRKYGKLTNRTVIAIVMRMITVSFMVMVSIMDTKTLTDMNVFSCRR